MRPPRREGQALSQQQRAECAVQAAVRSRVTDALVTPIELTAPGDLTRLGVRPSPTWPECRDFEAFVTDLVLTGRVASQDPDRGPGSDSRLLSASNPLTQVAPNTYVLVRGELSTSDADILCRAHLNRHRHDNLGARKEGCAWV